MNALIVCPPGSGATWLAEFLRRVGLPSTHETLFRPSPPRPAQLPDNWVEVSWLAVPFLSEVKADIKLRLIRNPLRTIRSILNKGIFDRNPEPYSNFARFYLRAETDPPIPSVTRACEMFMRWHSKISDRLSPDFSIYLEKLSSGDRNEIARLRSMLPFPNTSPEAAVWEIPERMNVSESRIYDYLSWDGLNSIDPSILVVAREQGYIQ